MAEELRKLFMPITKAENGRYIGILSDDSIDRDDELMGKNLLEDWSNSGKLPMLIDHENKFLNVVGGWRNFQKVEKGLNHALTAEPFFLNTDSGNIAKKQFDEMLKNDLNPGISIGARALEHESVVRGDKTYRQWTKAELLEASLVGMQSNRNAFGTIAKKFDLSGVKMANELNKQKEDDKEKDKDKEDEKDEKFSNPELQKIYKIFDTRIKVLETDMVAVRKAIIDANSTAQVPTGAEPKLGDIPSAREKEKTELNASFEAELKKLQSTVDELKKTNVLMKGFTKQEEEGLSETAVSFKDMWKGGN